MLGMKGTIVMYKCFDCLETFDEPLEYSEHIGEFWGSPAYETFCACPYCGSDAFDEEDIVDNELVVVEEEE